MQRNLINRWIKVFFALPLLLLAAMPLPIAPTSAQSSLELDSTAHQSAKITPPYFSYSSVFSQYKGYQEQDVTSWPEANATVGRIGGWRYYLEEASPSAQTDQQLGIPSQPLASPLSEEAGRHTGHEGKP
jgi:hypothetical protein